MNWTAFAPGLADREISVRAGAARLTGPPGAKVSSHPESGRGRRRRAARCKSMAMPPPSPSAVNGGRNRAPRELAAAVAVGLVRNARFLDSLLRSQPPPRASSRARAHAQSRGVSDLRRHHWPPASLSGVAGVQPVHRQITDRGEPAVLRRGKVSRVHGRRHIGHGEATVQALAAGEPR